MWAGASDEFQDSWRQKKVYSIPGIQGEQKNGSGKKKEKEMIENIIIIALFVYAVNATTWEDHIFEGVGNWAQENLPEKIYKPLIGCAICMTPHWGLVIYLVADVLGVPSFQDARWFMIIGTVIPAMGINALIVKITGALDDVADYFIHKQE